jgi:hypothetical protein
MSVSNQILVSAIATSGVQVFALALPMAWISSSGGAAPVSSSN